VTGSENIALTPLHLESSGDRSVCPEMTVLRHYDTAFKCDKITGGHDINNGLSTSK